MAIIAYAKSGKRAYRAKFKQDGRQITKAGFQTKKEAQKWIVEEQGRLLEAKKATPLGPEPTDLMFSTATDQYLCDCAARMQQTTVSVKFTHLKLFASWMGKDFEMTSITNLMAQQYAISLLKDVPEPYDPKKTVNRHIRDLKAMWNWHRKRTLQGENPFACVDEYAEDTAPRYNPPPKDVAAVLAVAESWQRDFLTVLATTGARPGEIRKLTWDDVDISRATITLWTRKRKGGARQPRTINMSPKLLELMTRRFNESGGDVVFTNPTTGKPLGRLDRPYRYMMERLCEKANVRFFTFYSFRHFVATKLRDSGQANKYEIQLILGHARSDTTDKYLRGLSPDVRDAISVLDSGLER